MKILFYFLHILQATCNVCIRMATFIKAPQVIGMNYRSILFLFNEPQFKITSFVSELDLHDYY